MADTPQNLKGVMKGEIVEIVCSDIRKSFALLKGSDAVREVQAFGDRLNVVVGRAQDDMPAVIGNLEHDGIQVQDWRVVAPSLENVFISLMTEHQSTKEREG